MPNIKAFRGSILHFLKHPAHRNDILSHQYIDDGLLILEDGKIKNTGDYTKLRGELAPNVKIIDYSNFLIMPGFIDTHIHYAQTEIIASYGLHLLEWLNHYVFPAEGRHVNKKYAEAVANFFQKELLRNGTTTAAIYSTIHKDATDTLFACFNAANMRIIAGKILMDRNAPNFLLDNPESSYRESKELIEKWHHNGRLLYAVTPRFAPTSTKEQLEIAAQLLREFPSTYLQTHISENKNEVEWVKKLFPWSKDYTDVYDHFNLLGSKSLFGHAIHISDREFQRLAETRSVIAWCPTSNFFLGSGLFNLEKARKYHNRISIGTDVGGGSSFSMLRTLSEAYKVAALQNSTISPLEGFYYLTLGNAKALSLDDKIGSFKLGNEADFIVLDLHSTPILSYKTSIAESLEEKLFNLAILGDDRAIKATYICGDLKHQKEEQHGTTYPAS